MSRPNLDSIPEIDATQLSWDAKINQALDDIEALLEDGPLPLKEYTTAQSLPAPSLYDRCIAAKEDATIGWHLELSDGTNWRILPTQCAHQADSTAVDVAGIVSDFNALLAKLQATGVMAGS